MLTTAKSLRVTLVKAEVAKVWKHLSSADSENTVLRLKSAPDGDKEINQEGELIINNTTHDINLHDLRADD